MLHDSFDYLIIGGGVAGTTAAETIRKNDANGSIGIVSDEPYNFYSRILLSKPNFFLEVVPFDNVWLRRDEWYAQNKITLLAGKTAHNLDAPKKQIILDDGQEIEYKKLLLAGGMRARLCNYPGGDKQGVFYLRTLDDAKKIMFALKSAKKAVVVGGGFIGFEMCDMLRLARIDTSMVIREKHFWYPRFDKVSGSLVEKAMRKHGIEVFLETEAQEIKGDQKVSSLSLTSGKEIGCDMIIFGIGCYTEHNWIDQAGVAVNQGVLSNEYLETNMHDIWTAGDAAEYKDVILRKPVQLGNWVNAQEQGRVAGQNMSSTRQEFHFVSFYTTQGLGVTIAFVGDTHLGKNKTVVTRGDNKLTHAQIILKDNRVIGAVLVNRTPELGVIRSLIERKLDVSKELANLSDSKFDLKKTDKNLKSACWRF